MTANSTEDAPAELRRLLPPAENRRTETGIPRLAMVKGRVPEHDLAAVYGPMINLIVQGSKTMTVGDRTLRYDPATYFVMSVDLPAIGTIHAAEDGAPYLAVALTLEPARIAALLADIPRSRRRRGNRAFPSPPSPPNCWTPGRGFAPDGPARGYPGACPGL